MLCINKRHSKEYVCIAELSVYCRRMEVRRSDNELKMGIYKCVIIKLLHQNKFVNIWTQFFTIKQAQFDAYHNFR